MWEKCSSESDEIIVSCLLFPSCFRQFARNNLASFLPKKGEEGAAWLLKTRLQCTSPIFPSSSFLLPFYVIHFPPHVIRDNLIRDFFPPSESFFAPVWIMPLSPFFASKPLCVVTLRYSSKRRLVWLMARDCIKHSGEKIFSREMR